MAAAMVHEGVEEAFQERRQLLSEAEFSASEGEGQDQREAPKGPTKFDIGGDDDDLKSSSDEDVSPVASPDGGRRYGKSVSFSQGVEGASEMAEDDAADDFGEVGARRAPLPQTSYASKAPASDRVAAATERAAAISAAFVNFFDRINREVAGAPAITAIAEALGVRPMAVVLGAMLSFFGFLLFGLGGQFVCMIVGGLYPAFESFKVIESGDEKEREFWLTYWVVYAAISSVEQVGYYVLVWLPFYYPSKLALLVWLASPSRGGTKYVYRWFISPVLLKNRDKIDEVLEHSNTKIRSGMKRAVSGAVNMTKDTAKGASSVGMQRLRRGLSMVRPGLGSVATICLETAAAAAARSRAMSGDAAAAMFGARAKAGDDGKAEADAAGAPQEPGRDEQATEFGDEPAAEPPASADAQPTPPASEASSPSAATDAAAAAAVGEAAAAIAAAAEAAERIVPDVAEGADAASADAATAAVSAPFFRGRAPSEDDDSPAGFFGAIPIAADTSSEDMGE